MYSSTDKVFNIGKIEGLCVVLEDTSLSQCDLNFRVNEFLFSFLFFFFEKNDLFFFCHQIELILSLTSNSDRDTFVVSGLTSTLYNVCFSFFFFNSLLSLLSINIFTFSFFFIIVNTWTLRRNGALERAHWFNICLSIK